MKRRQCSPFMMDMEVNRADKQTFNSCSDLKKMALKLWIVRTSVCKRKTRVKS